jgi:ADP-ribosylglycohydrolase
MFAIEHTNNLTREDRLRGAVWGQFVGDAATLGAHWIYNLDELNARFPEGLNGFEPPFEGHYHYGKQPGDQTHYGDAALLLLESVAEHGRFDPKKFGAAFVHDFRAGVYTGYIDIPTGGTIEIFDRFVAKHPADAFDFQQGADDDQPAAVTRLAAIAIRHAEDPDYLSVVESLTRVCQNNERAVAYAKFHALLLRDLLRGHSIPIAVRQAEDAIASIHPSAGAEIRKKSREAETEMAEDVVAATVSFGQQCPLAHSFPSALHAFLKHPDDFETAILETIRAGGDSAGRAGMLGSWLGAYLGFRSVPGEWCNRLTNADRISSALDKILVG